MSNIINWLESHISWILSTLVLIAMFFVGIKLIKFNNYNHETEQVIARYGGITPQVVQILGRDQANDLNQVNIPQFGKGNYKKYVASSDFILSTYSNKYQNGHLVMGAPNSDFNGNGERYASLARSNPFFEENANGPYIKLKNGTYVLDTKNHSKKHYRYGYYEADKNGTYVNVNGAYVNYKDKRLTTEERQSPRYKWHDVLSKGIINFIKDSKGNYRYVSIKKLHDYIWTSPSEKAKFAKQGKHYQYYTWKGKYNRYNKSTGQYQYGHFKNNSKTDHFVTTIYQTNQDGSTSNRIAQQFPAMTTQNGGKITYVVWIRFDEFGFHSLMIPTIHTVRSQVKQGSVE